VQSALTAAAIAVGLSCAVQAEPAGVWDLACKTVADAPRLGCVASTSITSQSTGQRVLRVELIPAGTLGNANAVLRVLLPHGIALNADVGVQIDGGLSFKAPLLSSSAEGLIAVQQIGADVVASLKAGSIMEVTVINLAGDTLKNTVSLVGLTLVLDAVARIDAAD
jgi:invasion protein IalB